MKKILVAINGPFTPQHVISFAINIAKSTSSFLHAFFLNYAFQIVDYNYPFPNDLSLTRNRLTGKNLAEENAELLESNTKIFKDECQAAKVEFQINTNTEISLSQLIENSAFCDFIIADGTTNTTQYHLVDLLINAHCPVYLVSKNDEQVKNVILAYDGSFSSIKAIKMFSYIFPELKDLPTSLVHISSGKGDDMPNEENLRTWLTNHYSNIQNRILHGNIREELANFINSTPISLVVMGAYGRTAISRLFHKSLANTVIQHTKSSLFITHE